MKTANQDIKPITTRINDNGNIEIGGCDLIELINMLLPYMSLMKKQFVP